MKVIATDSPQFPCGTQDWEASALMAGRCILFTPDVEEEQIADEPRSCYNCRYRRWSVDAITCCGDSGIKAADCTV